MRCVGRYTTPEYEAAIQRIIDQYEAKKPADREFFAAITGMTPLYWQSGSPNAGSDEIKNAGAK